MDAALRDRAAAAALDPERVFGYLVETGWAPVPIPPGEGLRLVERDTPRGKRQILFGDRRFADYGQGMLALVERVAEVEGRSQMDVYADLLGEDVVFRASWRPAGAPPRAPAGGGA